MFWCLDDRKLCQRRELPYIGKNITLVQTKNNSLKYHTAILLFIAEYEMPAQYLKTSIENEIVFLQYLQYEFEKLRLGMGYMLATIQIARRNLQY